jgi:hypothetical protein
MCEEGEGAYFGIVLYENMHISYLFPFTFDPKDIMLFSYLLVLTVRTDRLDKRLAWASVFENR